MATVKFNKEFLDKLEEYGATVRIEYQDCLYDSERNCLECNKVENPKWKWNGDNDMFDGTIPELTEHFTIFFPVQVNANLYISGTNEIDKEVQFLGRNIYDKDSTELFITKSSYEQFVREVCSDMTLCDNVIGNTGELAKTAYYWKDYKEIKTYIRQAPSTDPIILQDGGTLYIEGQSTYDLYIVQNGVKTLIQENVKGDLRDAEISCPSSDVVIKEQAIIFDERGTFEITVTLGKISVTINVVVTRDFIIGFTTRFIEDNKAVLLFKSDKSGYLDEDNYIYIYSIRPDFSTQSLKVKGLTSDFESIIPSTSLDNTMAIKITPRSTLSGDSLREAKSCYVTYKNKKIPGTDFKCVQVGSEVVGGNETKTINIDKPGEYTYSLGDNYYEAELYDFSDGFVSAYLDHSFSYKKFILNCTPSPGTFKMDVYRYTNKDFIYDPTNWKDFVYTSKPYKTISFSYTNPLRWYKNGESSEKHYLICCKGNESSIISVSGSATATENLSGLYTVASGTGDIKIITPNFTATSITPSDAESIYFKIGSNFYHCCSVGDTDSLGFLSDSIDLDPTSTNTITINKGDGSWKVSGNAFNISCSTEVQNISSIDLGVTSNPKYLTTTTQPLNFDIRRVFDNTGNFSNWKNQFGRMISCPINIKGSNIEESVKIIEEEIVFDKVGLYKFHVQSTNNFYISLGKNHDRDGIYFFDKFNDTILKDLDTQYFDGSLENTEIVLAFCNGYSSIDTNILVQDIKGNKALRKIEWNNNNGINYLIEGLDSRPHVIIANGTNSCNIRLRSEFGLKGEIISLGSFSDIQYSMKYEDIDESYRGYIETTIKFTPITMPGTLSFPLNELENVYINNSINTYRYHPSIYLIPGGSSLTLIIRDQSQNTYTTGDQVNTGTTLTAQTDYGTILKVNETKYNTASISTTGMDPGLLSIQTYVDKDNFLKGGVWYKQKEVNYYINPKSVDLQLVSQSAVSFYISKTPSDGKLDNFKQTTVTVSIIAPYGETFVGSNVRFKQGNVIKDSSYTEISSGVYYKYNITFDKRYQYEWTSRKEEKLDIYEGSTKIGEVTFEYPEVSYELVLRSDDLNIDNTETYYGTENTIYQPITSSTNYDSIDITVYVYGKSLQSSNQFTVNPIVSNYIGVKNVQNTGAYIKFTLYKQDSGNNQITIGDSYSGYSVTLKNIKFPNTFQGQTSTDDYANLLGI